MAKASKYVKDPLVSLSDFLLGTDSNDNLSTKNFLIKSVLSLFNDANNTASLPVTYEIDTVNSFSFKNGLINTVNNVLEPNLVTGFKINKFNNEGVDLSSLFNMIKVNKTMFSFGLKINGNPNFVNSYSIIDITDLLDLNSNVIGFLVNVTINGTIYTDNFKIGEIYSIDLKSSAGISGTAAGTSAPINVILSAGKTIGKYGNGATIPVKTTIQELIKDIAQELTLPTFIAPTSSLSASIAPNSTTEVGASISPDLTALLTQNDGGAANQFLIKKDGVSILTDPVLNHIISAITLGAVPIVFQAVVDYDAGTTPKNDSLGNPVANTIAAGSANSNTLSYRGYYKIFYGPVAAPANSSATVRALATNRFENAGNVFNLVTGSTELNFQFWLPTGKNLVSVIDLDALNANITSSYVATALSVNDAGGTPVAGTLYTMTQGVAYGTSHNHQITIA